MAYTGLMLPLSWLCLLVSISHISAYVPASPTNATGDAITAFNASEVSKLYLNWYPNASYSQNVSYQLVGSGSTGLSMGALVHFSETKVNLTTPGTETPWIAMVSCDFNATNASQEVDVFTLARDRGARAALLYSLYSTACIINPEYADPSTFEQVFDIVSTQNRISASLIEGQFQESSFDQSLYGSYDSALLNSSAVAIANAMITLSVDAPGFMFAIIRAANASEPLPTPGTVVNAPAPSTGNGSSPSTALAMIVLYVITGCVTALFCIVIISGAIRALRHPERYGPRAHFNEDGTVVQQSRAKGLARAVLDTFPIVKFGSSSEETIPPHKDPENQRDSDVSRAHVELREFAEPEDHIVDGVNYDNGPGGVADITESMEPPTSNAEAGSSQVPTSSRTVGVGRRTTLRRNDDAGASPTRQNAGPSARTDVQLESMGRETCPICIVDFEEGDGLRQLPCEGKHRFHQECVDPWLLELSSSCPLCRQDFLALENMLSGSAVNDDGNEHLRHSYRHSQPLTNRFSRYLRFAHRRARRADQANATDFYMPTAPETSM